MRSILIFITLLWPFISSQAQSYKFFTTDDELSSSLINQIYQDRNNMIWIATEDGLNRYDGTKFTIYRHKPNDKHSLAHDYVRAVFEDDKGQIIVGSYAGLQLYDPATDSFSAMAKDETGEVFRSFTTRIFQRKNGEIWATGNSMCQIEVIDGELRVKKLQLPIPTTLIEYGMEDQSGNLWITKEGEGVYRLTPDNQVIHYTDSKEVASILTMCEDSRGNIYAGSLTNGLFRYDKRSDRFLPLLDKNNQNLPVKSLFCPDMNTLYICTDGQGLKQYNIHTSQLSDYLFEDKTINSPKSKVHFMLIDNSGNYWFAIYQKGVLMSPKQTYNFMYWGSKSGNRDIIGSNCITSLCKGHDDVMYVGTDNDGLYTISRDYKSQRHYAPTGLPGSMPSIIMALYEDSERNLWIGSYTEGGGWLNKKTGQYERIQGLVDMHGTVARNVYDFAEDREKRVWIATMGGGLFYYDLKKKELVYDAALNERLLNNWICCLLYLPDKNQLYVGTYAGLNCIDLNTPEKAVTFSMDLQIIHTLCADRHGNIWAGTSEGLLCQNHANHETRIYTIADGLPSNTIYSIQTDETGSLWISTNGGLSRHFPATGQFVNYSIRDGLQGNEFCKNASFHDKDGTLWFGGINGITYFHPRDILISGKKWTVRITDFYLHDKPVRAGMKSGRHDIIDRPVFLADRFNLSHRDHSFSIEFSTLELHGAGRIAYAYKMNDSEWNELPAGINRVSFVDLTPGIYHFYVKAQDYQIESDVKEITIHITPPWWASGGAKVSYAVLALLLLYAGYLLLRNRYRTRQQMLEHIHRNEINETKQQFFINISHEIRTPMSLIISPLQQLINTDTDETRQKSYRVIRRNADRILRLINQLMDIRKIEKKQMILTFQEIELTGFITDLCDIFTELSEQKHIRLKFHHEGMEQVKLWVDMANFDKIILNILSNAFKFTPDGGEVNIFTRIGEDHSTDGPLRRYVEITIADSGKGIAPTELEKIFERFYQTRDSQNSYVGTGIGLHLTRSLVELHHGDIHAENNPDGQPGCRFIIRIPLGNAHLKPEELATESPDIRKIHHVDLPIPAEAPADQHRPEQLDARVKHYILIVEDNEEIRNYICQELSANHHVTACSNGKEAIELVFKKEPELIISDVMMPEMDGITLCRKLKQNIHKKHIPIILLTAKTRDEDNIEGLENGADAYLTKPFNIEVLQHTVNNLINNREQLRSHYSGNLQMYDEQVEKPDMQTPDERLMERLMKVINANLSNANLTVEMLATEVGYSRVHLGRKLKELTGQSPRDFIRNTRLKQAANLLSEKRHAISEVADMVGFSNIANFSTVFKELYGMTPMEYRESNPPAATTPSNPAPTPSAEQ